MTPTEREAVIALMQDVPDACIDRVCLGRQNNTWCWKLAGSRGFGFFITDDTAAALFRDSMAAWLETKYRSITILRQATRHYVLEDRSVQLGKGDTKLLALVAAVRAVKGVGE